MTVRVVTATEAAARDEAAIASGIPSRALMQRAGAGAAAEIARRFADRLGRGVSIFAGPGNNGGDAWVVAGALGVAGVRVRVTEVGATRSTDARCERDAALPYVEVGDPTGAEEVVVDGLLGTGARDRPRGAVAGAIARVRELRSHGARVVALDLPSGVDATSGAADESVSADLTLTFGTVKRGHLIARDRCGDIAVLDIGLGTHAELSDGAPLLVDERWVAARVPRISADAHKGTRKRLAIVGGAVGMAGATVLAARAASRSGAGIVRLIVASGSVAPVQTAAYDTLARAWPESDEQAVEVIADWANGVLIGPGLGKSPETRGLVERVLRTWKGPVVLDADALNVFENDAPALGALLSDRPAVITPHVNEFSRLASITPRAVLDSRFEAGLELAERLHAVVLLKGVPTVVSSPTGERFVSAAGTPVLAQAGSGDVLAGILATLLTQTNEPISSAAVAAFVHGRAGEVATERRQIRGVSLSDVLDALPAAWAAGVAVRYPVLAELGAVGEAELGRA